jgi:hypothetical protein
LSRARAVLWLLAMIPIACGASSAQTAPATAAATQDGGYWRHEGQTLHDDFDDNDGVKGIYNQCAMIKADWAQATFGDKLGDFVSCAGSVQGNAFMFDFGQAPPDNQIGLGLALADGDPIKYEDAKRRPRDLDIPWKIAGDISTNASWTAYGMLGLHLEAVITSPSLPRHVDYPFFYIFAGSQKAQTLAYFGEGLETLASAQTNYSLQRTTVMGRAEIPVTVHSGLRQTYFFGFEFGGRWYSIANGPAPGISTVNNGAAPWLFTATVYFDQSLVVKARNQQTTGTGNSITDYQTGVYLHHTDAFEAKFTNRIAESAPQYSYRQFWLDEVHDTVIRCHLPGPQGLSPCFTLQLEGSMTESVANAGKTIPFFLQPTVGGSDIENNLSLPSYTNYRFRAPSVEYANASFFVPAGSSWIKYIEKIPFLTFMMRADTGKAALRRDDLAIVHMRHSLSAGIALSVGNVAAINLFYSFAGAEGGQFQKLINPQLLGKGIADYW